MNARLRLAWLGGWMVLTGCGQTATPASDRQTDDATGAVAADATATDTALSDTHASATDAQDAPPHGDSGADGSAANTNCPVCPTGQKCRPDQAICVGAGVVQCDPACAAGLVCRLNPPPACVLQTCKLPATWSADVVKLTTLSLTASAAACGKDNHALGQLATKLPLLTQLLGDAVANDQATVLLEPNGLTATGGPGSLRWLFGTRAPTHLKCNPTSLQAVCAYTVSQACWDRATAGTGPCAPWMVLPASWSPPTIAGEPGTLSGGQAPQSPAGDRLQFAVPLAGGGQVLLQLFGPRLQATVKTAAAGEPAGPLGWRQIEGTLCGAVPLDDLDAALAGLPAATLESLGGLEAARKLRAQLLPGDTDLDGDGKADAASAAIGFQGTRATISGLSPLGPNGQP